MLKKSKVFTVIKLFRIQASLAINLFIFIPLMVKTGNCKYSALQTFPFILMICGEIALNDCCDIDKDKISKPNRPLVSGNISVNSAFGMALMMIFSSLIAALLIYHGHLTRYMIFLLLTVLLTIYNIPLSFISYIKTIITAAATVLGLSFLSTFPDMLPDNYFYFLAGTFFFILGRETMMDIRDITGDRANHYITLAVLLGRGKTTALTLACIAVSDLFYIMFILMSFKTYKAVAFVIAFLAELFICRLFIKAVNPSQQNLAALFLWIPMLLMIVSIIHF